VKLLKAKNIYIFPTRYGVMFTFVLMAMLLGSINYNNNLGFILTFLLGSMAFVSILHTYRNISGIRILSVTAKPVFAGDRSPIELLVQPAHPRRSAVEFVFLNGNKTSRDLRADTRNRIHLSVSTKQRGIFRPGPLFISTQYPLGLFFSRVRLNPDIQCMVYPKPLTGASRSSNDFSNNGEGGERLSIGVDDFIGLRVYQPGDSPHRISWKTFSKGHGLATKEFTEYHGEAVIFDWNRLTGLEPEHKLSWLCGMVLKAHSRNMVYGLQLPGITIDSDTGKSHRHKCLKALALYGLPPDDQ